MNYSKPEVLILGEAVEVIQGGTKNFGPSEQPPLTRKILSVNAYDLDE